VNLNLENAQISLDLDGHMTLSFAVCPESVRALRTGFDALKGIKLSVALKKWYKKRSIDSNAYAWLLIGKLSEVLKITPVEVYRQAIKDIGGNYVTVPISNEAKDTWIKNWRSHGIGWVCEELGESKIDGYTNIISYYGSSTYDSAQMARLISLIVDECKTQGIETMTPQELKALCDRWGNAQKDKSTPNP